MSSRTKDEWRYCGQDPIPKGLQKTALGDFTKNKHTGKPCQCGFIWSVLGDCPIAQVIRGDWGDEYPAIRIETPGAIGEKAEPYMEKLVYGSIDDATADANIRLMVQAPAMLALLERWAKKFKNLPDVSYGMWLGDSAKAKDHHKLFSLLADTKNLLKEVKVVRDE